MKKITLWLIKYKKIIKWTGLNLFVIIFGVSIIINITYLPKYWALAARGDTALKIEILGFDKTNNNEQLFNIHYESIMATLGDLMTNYPHSYQLKNKGALAREIYSITFYDEKLHHDCTLVGGTEKQSPYHWEIDNNNDLPTSGIDSVYLQNNDIYKLYYWKE